MAKLLVRTVNGENPRRYMNGDVVAALPDDHVFGRLESLAVWVMEGRDPAQWPGGFAIVELTGMSLADAQQYVQPADDGIRRRKHTIDYESLERRSAGSGRDTLRMQAQIKRSANDADVIASFRVKS